MSQAGKCFFLSGRLRTIPISDTERFLGAMDKLMAPSHL